MEATNGDELILLAIEDITERRSQSSRCETSELRYRRLFETAKDGILILDASTGKIIDANPFMTELLGYSHDEFLGKELWEIGLFRDIDASRAAFRGTAREGLHPLRGLAAGDQGRAAGRGRVRQQPLSGRSYSPSSNATSGTSPNAASWSEAKLKAETLADSNRRKDEFLAMLSHELRNPLAPILNAVHLLRLQGNENLIQQAGQRHHRASSGATDTSCR